MISVLSIYEDVLRDDVGENENGRVGIDRFNRLSRRAELDLIDWLTGDISAIVPPEPYLSQKSKDFLAPFIKKYPAQVVDGGIDKPSDYYGYENFYKIGTYKKADCDTDEIVTINEDDPVITLVDGDVFNGRKQSYIEGLKPTFKTAIAKMVGNRIEVSPKDLGSVTLEYYRYPVYAALKKGTDPVYNNEIALKDKDYEWDEKARNLLVWFIVNRFHDHTREQAGKQSNMITGKTVRETK